MEGRSRYSRPCGDEPAAPGRRSLLAGLLAAPVTALTVPGTAQAQAQQQQQQQQQGAWRGLNPPRYPNANDYRVTSDEKEYEISFSSPDSAQAVFDFYRGYLEQQGFRVTNSTTKASGLKADMVRGQGGPGGTIELEAEIRNGRHEVEIEFED